MLIKPSQQCMLFYVTTSESALTHHTHCCSGPINFRQRFLCYYYGSMSIHYFEDNKLNQNLFLTADLLKFKKGSNLDD